MVRMMRFSVSLSLFLMMICLTGCQASSNGTIELDVPDIVEIGDQFTIQGLIDPSAPVLFPDELILMIRAPMDSHVEQFSTLTPATDRTFEKTITADIIGEWTVSARYGDAGSGTSEVKVVPRTTRMRATLDLLPYGAPVETGEDVPMSGTLRDPSGNGISHREITYEVGLPSYTWSGSDVADSDRVWQIYGTTTTDETGSYSFSFPVYDTGEFGVRAVFAGDDTYRAARSTVEHVIVR